MRFNRSGDIAGNLVLYGENVTQLAVISFGPVMSAAHSVDELRADAKPIAGASHAAFEHVADAKRASDLFNVNRAVLVNERRVTGDNEQPPDAGQASD